MGRMMAEMKLKCWKVYLNKRSNVLSYQEKCYVQ